MRNFHLVGAALIAATVSFAPAAMALSPKTFVSATGNDANTATNCSKNDPCRGFAAAYSVTNVGGQIVAIDTGVYGQLTITKAVTLTAAPGVTAEVLVPSGGSGFTVSAGASDLVVLRNITVFGTVAPTTGITHTSGRLIVDHVIFSGLSTGMTSTAKSDIVDSRFEGNATGLRVTGEGCLATGPPTCGAVSARLNGGVFLGNSLALDSVSSGDNRSNILEFSLSENANAYTTEFAGNTNFMTFTAGSRSTPVNFYGTHNAQ